MVTSVAASIRSRRFRYVDEDRLQEGIAAVLVEDGFDVEREYRLDDRSRLDMLVDGRVGVEVKIAGSRADVQRQIDRYLGYGLTGLVLVTTRSAHMGVSGDLVEVVCLNGAGL